MNVAVFGSSGHGGVVAEAILSQGTHNFVGWIDSFRSPGDIVGSYCVLGSEKDIPDLLAQRCFDGLAIAIGDNWQRAKVAERLQPLCRSGLVFITVIHPNANISASALIGEGTVVLSGAVITAHARVGRFCIVNTSASLDHDCVMADYSSLAPKTATGGRVSIGEYSAVSIGAIIVHRIVVGHHCLIGAGATVLRDVPDHAVCYGTPAKTVRYRAPGESYL